MALASVPAVAADAFLIPGFKAPEFTYVEDNWYLTLGLGVRVQPSYPGGQQYLGVPFPVINLSKGRELYDFQSVDDSSSIALFDNGSISTGAAWSLNFGRDEDDSPHLTGLGDVDPTFELGGFVQWFPVNWFRFRGELRYGMGGFSGWVADLGADFIVPYEQWRFSLGPRLSFAGSGYMDTFYGVTASQAAVASFYGNALPIYRPSSGLDSWGLTAQMTRNFGDGFTWGMYATYANLVGSASDSPVTSNRNQFEAGMSLSYAFNLGKAWW
ncbi:outer membrane protein [Aquabacter spiritensis]|uniref:Outer membrane protein n=2 Tax=Aquabacter spiritensis TaxID=933073 RepID=A0A4R3LW15_9HYPH|nr:outer membrane protein [Aquabacter spiritensis]